MNLYTKEQFDSKIRRFSCILGLTMSGFAFFEVNCIFSISKFGFQIIWELYHFQVEFWKNFFIKMSQFWLDLNCNFDTQLLILNSHIPWFIAIGQRVFNFISTYLNFSLALIYNQFWNNFSFGFDLIFNLNLVHHWMCWSICIWIWCWIRWKIWWSSSRKSWCPCSFMRFDGDYNFLSYVCCTYAFQQGFSPRNDASLCYPKFYCVPYLHRYL